MQFIVIRFTTQTLCCIFLLLLVFFQQQSAKAQVLEVELGQIQELSREYSLQWQQFDNRLNYAVAGEQTATTPLNPSLHYDLEFLDDGLYREYEHSVYLQKEFRTPGHYRSLRDRRDSRINLIDHQTHRDKAEWLAETRLGFIQIVLIEHELEMINILLNQISKLIDASIRRADEGETSPLDDQLLQLSNYQLQARIQERHLEKNRLQVIWKNRMGFDEDVEIRFIGQFDEPDIQMPDPADMLALLDESPQARANRIAMEAAGYEVALERNRVIPSFELSVGYMRLNPNWQGFLFGVAVPLPVLSANTRSIEQARSLERIEQTNLTTAQRERNLVTFQLFEMLEEYDELLGQFPEYLNNPEQFLNRLTLTYEEGIQSLSDVLTTLNIMADTYQTKYTQLAAYYSLTTELEAITGRQFVDQ